MPEAPRERMCPIPRLRALAPCLLVALLAACGGGVGGDGNDGEFVDRTGIVLRGVFDDGTATSPVAGGTCRLVDTAGNVLDSSTTERDGSYLLLLDPERLAFVVCAGAGQAQLALRTFVSTVGLPQGGELPGQDVLPATTMLARIVAAEAADDPAVDAAARLAALSATLVPFGSDTAPGNADLQLLADAATIAYDRLRDAGEDLDFDAFLTDLYDDGELDFFAGAAAADEIESAVAERAVAAGRTLPDAVLATHPAFEFSVLNVGGARSVVSAVDRFATLLADARLAAGDRAVLTLSAGNTLAAGVSLVAGLETQDPFFDALAVDALAVDALGLGAEDLEFGPQVYGIFLDRLAGDSVVVVTDIDPSLEPNAFIPGAVTATTGALILDRNARRIGLVGATPEDLPRVTATRSLITFEGDARTDRIQAGVDAAQRVGARLMILLASERDLAALETLVGALRDVDLVVTLPGVPAVDGSFAGEGPRPLALEAVEDADGNSVPVVPGFGAYAGLVEAVLRADPLGRLDGAATTAQVRRVAAADEATPTAPDADVARDVTEPLATAIDTVRTTEAGQHGASFDPRPETIFFGESGWGSLVADAVLFTARSQSRSFSTLAPQASMVDAGSMDSAEERAPGPLTRGDLYDLVDDGQLITVLEQVPPADFERLLEFAFANRGSDLFTQLGGLLVEFDPDGTAQVLAEDGSVLVAGDRVVSARIGETFIVRDGALVENAPSVTLAVSERVRDVFPLGEIELTNLGATVDQALDAYVRTTLRGSITAERYPAGGEGRIEVADGT